MVTSHGGKVILPIEIFYVSRDPTARQSPLDTPVALSVSAEGREIPGIGASPLSICGSW